MEGLRVLRGPDWDQGDTDGGEGYTGTVTALLGNHRVQVHWDMGQDSTCRAGHDGKCDVRVFDTAPVGVRHPNITCAECGEMDILGMLWRCQVCSGCDLCTLCYNDDKHDLRHQFLRIDAPGEKGKPLPKRKTSVKVRAIGIFPGSKVVRGRDWEWSDQDGGQGSEGEVKGYAENVSAESSRNQVTVEWPNGVVSSYRLGFHGNVDLTCVEEEVGPYFYRDHLPLLDTREMPWQGMKNASVTPSHYSSENTTDQPPRENTEISDKTADADDVSTVTDDVTTGAVGGITETTAAPEVPPKTEEPQRAFGKTETPPQDNVQTPTEPERLCVRTGDRVAIRVGDEKLKELQRECGGCTARMIKCIGRTGEVTSVLSQGVVCVRFGSESKVSYRFNSLALIQVCDKFSVGDKVRIRNDGPLVRILNSRVGWHSHMDGTLNKVGLVKRVDDDGESIHVDFKGHEHVYAPACCILAPDADVNSLDDVKSLDDVSAEKLVESEIINSADQSEDPSHNLMVFNAVKDMLAKDAASSRSGHGVDHSKALFGAISAGSFAHVRYMCEQDMALLEREVEDMTPLIYAALRGQGQCMVTLLELGADVNRHAHCDQRRTPLSAAIEGKDPSVLEVLLQHGADVNYVFTNGHTGVHHAVIKNKPVAIQLLAKFGADMNAKDVFGDTPLHMAIERRAHDATAALLECGQVDMYVTNKDNFNSIHLACLVGNPTALAKLLSRDRSGVDRMRTQSTALHMAATADHVDCVRLLVIEGGAEVDKRDGGKGLTALHIACLGGSLQTAEALMELGAEVNVRDRDGDTPLHFAIGGKIENYGMSEKAEVEVAYRVQIANMLISNGAYVDARNEAGKHPFLYGHNRVREGIRTFMMNNKDVVKWKNKELGRLTLGSSRSSSHSSISHSSSSSGRGREEGQLREALKGVGLPCGVCGAPKSDVTLLPCQHKCVCSACSVKVTLCPLCDVEVKDKVCTGQDDQTVDPEACKQM